MRDRKKYKELAKTLIEELEKKSIEREELSRVLVLSLFSKTNVFLIGEPGIGKTYLISKLIKSVKDAKYFEYLVMHHTPPEDLFGTQIVEQQTGRMIHNYQDSVLDSDFVFLDEIFKGNATILNTMLGIANERRFYLRGYGTFKVPLIALFAASNELPEDESLKALDDRFIIRYEVFRIRKPENYVRFLKGEYDKSDNFSIELYKRDIEHIFNEALSSVEITNEIVYFLERLRRVLLKLKVDVSDRRVNFILNILKVSAYLNDRDYVDYSDLMILKHILWKKFYEKEGVLEGLHDTIFHNKTMIENVLQDIDNKFDKLRNVMKNDLIALIEKRGELSRSGQIEEYNRKKELIEKAFELSIFLLDEIATIKNEYFKDMDILKQCEENIFVYSVDYNAFTEDHIRKIMDIDSNVKAINEKLDKFLELCPNAESYIAYSPYHLNEVE